MNPLSLITGAVSGIGNAVSSVARVFVGDKSQREQMRGAENMATYAQFASEFQVQNRTWFDSLIDGINRIPRPAIVFLVIAYFVMAYADPIEFQKVNLALDTVPDDMWLVLSAIVGFYFVAREFQKSRDKKMALPKEQFDEHLRRMDALDQRKRDREPVIEDEAFQAAMEDTSKPLSNAAIMEWNRRRRAG